MLEPKDLDLKGEFSEVLFITGLLCKGRTDQDVEQFLSTSGVNIVETKQQVDAPGGGKLWVRCESIQLAKKAQAVFHQQSFRGAVIMCRYELGFDPVTGKRRVSRNSIHTTCIRRVQRRRGESNNRNKEIDEPLLPANYSHKSLSIGEIEYPFPSGIYLARLVSLVQQWPDRNDPLLELVSNNYSPTNAKNDKNSSSKKKKNGTNQSVFGNRYPKEITESMAMVDAVERALKLCLGRSASSFFSSDGTTCVRVYCVGDGKYPVSAACMALHYPHPGWEFVSIDPLLEPLPIDTNPKIGHRHNLIQFTGLSQDYAIPQPPPTAKDEASSAAAAAAEIGYLDIVVACHSHAPLQEFWDRVLARIDRSSRSCRAIAVTMACCANYSDLAQPVSLVFEDYEVYSPKRQIRIYSDNLFCSEIGGGQ